MAPSFPRPETCMVSGVVKKKNRKVQVPKKILQNRAMWMKPEDRHYYRSEISQFQKDKYYIIPLLWDSKIVKFMNKERLQNNHKIEEMKEKWLKCNMGSWIESWDRKRTLVDKVYSLVNKVVLLLTFQFLQMCHGYVRW